MGWMDLKSPLNGDVPFRLFRDEGRSFLQWDGEPDLRSKLAGRLILVYLKCKEAIDVNNLAKIITPSVAFRVVGSPVNNLNPYNVSEVTFVSNAQSSTEEIDSLSTSEYVAIGICSVLLGLIYVASVFLYLHIRKKNRLNQPNRNSVRNKDAHVMAEEGVVKNNPLLDLAENYQAPDSDITSEEGPGEIRTREERIKHIQRTSAIIHPRQVSFSENRKYSQIEYPLSDSTTIERLPEENVSIVETLEGREDKIESSRTPPGSQRKKLYFNPAYFEPHLLAAPPPAAIDFLTKIREVITIAKQKMQTKRFSPSLIGIPEEDYGFTISAYNTGPPSSRRGSVVSLKRENSRRKTCSGCPGCEPQKITDRLAKIPSLPGCQNCTITNSDSKQRSIRKWLANIPPTNNEVNIEKNIEIKIPKTLRTPSESSPVSFRSNNSSKKLNRAACSIRSNSPARSLPSDYGESPRPMSPSIESEYSGSEGKARPSRRKQRAKIRKPKLPPPLPPSNKKSLENIYDTVANEGLTVDLIQGPMDTNTGLGVQTITKDQMRAVIDELSIQKGFGKVLQTLDYEVDSLERTSRRSIDCELSSSQPSPSLSTALPVNEELTVSNAVFNVDEPVLTKCSTNKEDLDEEYQLIVLKRGANGMYKLPELLKKAKGYSLVSEVYVNNGYNFNSSPSTPSVSNNSTMERKELKICYAEDNKPGKLLIEVEDCPDHYIPVNDSDEFEPDTLDRKPLKKIGLAPNFNDPSIKNNQILLRTNGSFRKESLNNNVELLNRNFGSLREIYEAKTKEKIDKAFFTILNPDEEKERILTLEERHSKRQRNTVQPDVIPPPPHDVEGSPLYDQPKPPRKVLDNIADKPPIPPKNGKNRNTISSTDNYDQKKLSSNGIPENCATKVNDKLMELENYDVITTLIENHEKSNFRKGNDQFINTNPNNVPLNNIHNFINKELKKSWIKNELNIEKNVNAEKIANTEEMVVSSSKATNNTKRAWQRFVDGKIEDSGYLSTDSNESRAISSQVASSNERGSETDESLGDGQSESGAESVETHSVFFGRFRKNEYVTVSMDSGVDLDGKRERVVLEEPSSDSEHTSYATVIAFGDADG